jgi:hypothetical protein
MLYFFSPTKIKQKNVDINLKERRREGWIWLGRGFVVNKKERVADEGA